MRWPDFHDRVRRGGRMALTLVVVSLVSCTSPLERTLEEQLREQLVGTNQRHRRAVASGPVIELTRQPSDVEAKLRDERRAELDRMSGMEAYAGVEFDLGRDLLGEQDTDIIAMTLRRAVQLAAVNNLDVRLARLVPAINQTLVTQAEARFDALIFAELDYAKLDTPRPPALVAGGLATAFGSTQEETFSLQTGIRKRLSSGGQASISTEFTRSERQPPLFALNPFYTAGITLDLEQPLLRNFGSDVNRAEILINRSQREQSVEEFKQELLETLLETEQAYWNLVFARQRLVILRRLLDRTVKDRDQLEQRGGYDVSPVRVTEANSFVELRRADVIRARQSVRLASDQLKQLINAPELPVASETLIVPLEEPADAPINFSLLDAVTTALRHRPEIRRALLQIKDASIRQRVADNLRLPELNLAASVRFNGVNDDIGGSYDHLTELDFIDYLVAAQFETPIGNRGPEALYQQRKIERRAAVISYQNVTQRVVLEVKNALRDLITSYEIIGAARAARRAAADNLRVLEAQEEAGVALTPEFLLDLKLSTQQRLADAETQEVQALVQYNTAIAAYYRTLGTLLEYNGIEFHDWKRDER